MFELSVFLRDKLIARSVFEQQEIRIGRSIDNEVQIDNVGLSRYHASIEEVNGVYVLKDFASQNGTFVNGDKVEGRRALSDGDRITIGKFTLHFKGDSKGTPEATVRDAAAYAVAGETIVVNAPEAARERPCPYVAFLEPVAKAIGPEPPKIHPLVKDTFVIGSGKGCDLVVEGAPSRSATIVRGWRGFQLVAFAPGSVQRNRTPVELRSELGRGDELVFGTTAYRYQVGRSDAGV